MANTRPCFSTYATKAMRRWSRGTIANKFPRPAHSNSRPVAGQVSYGITATANSRVEMSPRSKPNEKLGGAGEEISLLILAVGIRSPCAQRLLPSFPFFFPLACNRGMTVRRARKIFGAVRRSPLPNSQSSRLPVERIPGRPTRSGSISVIRRTSESRLRRRVRIGHSVLRS